VAAWRRVAQKARKKEVTAEEESRGGVEGEEAGDARRQLKEAG